MQGVYENHARFEAKYNIGGKTVYVGKYETAKEAGLKLRP